jgi:hypothetical protein
VARKQPPRDHLQFRIADRPRGVDQVGCVSEAQQDRSRVDVTVVAEPLAELTAVPGAVSPCRNCSWYTITIKLQFRAG